MICFLWFGEYDQEKSLSFARAYVISPVFPVGRIRGEGHPALRGSPGGVFLKRRLWPGARGIPGEGPPDRLFFGRGGVAGLLSGVSPSNTNRCRKNRQIKRNEEISRRISRAGCSFSRRFFLLAKNRLIRFTFCRPKLVTFFHKSGSVDDSATNHIYVVIINHRLWATAGCSAKRKGRVHQATKFALNPVPPVGMRLLSSDPMKVFPCLSSEAHGKCEELKKNEYT